MPLPTDTLIDRVAAAAAAFAADVSECELTDQVPSCPEWTVADLVAHLGGVHRWATAVVAEGLTQDMPEGRQQRLFRAPGEREAMLRWFRSGADDLVAALRNAPEDLVAFRFLKNAPPARRFWARRQCHETTMHRVDALAARLGRLPSTAEAAIGRDLAVDGVDELLTGFLPRRSSTLHSPAPVTFEIAPRDTDARWTVVASADPPVSTRTPSPAADAVLSGTAAALYLALWNRGDDIAVDGDPAALDLWREQVRVRWA